MGYHTKTQDGFEVLAACILKQAVLDYKAALRSGSPSSIHAMQRFFRGEWCRLLSTVSGEVLMELTEKEIEEERKRKNGKIRKG